jgi:hypothetical protein
MSRTLVVGQSWGAVLEVLKHEMAHQYVHEILARTDETCGMPEARGSMPSRSHTSRNAGPCAVSSVRARIS